MKLAGMPIALSACWIASTAAPSEEPGARLNEIVVAGNWPRWVISSGPGLLLDMRDRRERHLPLSSMTMTADRWIDSRSASVCSVGSRSRMTRYWFDWV